MEEKEEAKRMGWDGWDVFNEGEDYETNGMISIIRIVHYST